MEKFADNKVMIYLQPELREVVQAVAKQDKLLNTQKRPNISGAIKKIIVEWQQLTGFNPNSPRPMG